MPDAEESFKKAGAMTMDEFCYIFRTCSFKFLMEVKVPEILTSKLVSLKTKS